MEFQPHTPTPPPKNLFPCLATITLGAAAARRLSGSAVADDGGDGAGLMRVISGNRRRTSFGQAAVRNDDGAPPRKSFDSGKGGAGVDYDKGTWYWRVQVGVNDSHLVLLPLSEPANALLTTKPAPLSHVMPGHSEGHHTDGDKESIGDKIKHLFTGHKKDTPASTTTGGHDAASADTGATAVEKITDQTASGQPRAGDAHAESGWPGVIQGQKLGGIVVSLHNVVQQGVQLGGGNKEGNWVVVPINAGFPGIGQTSESAPKSGSIKFEFDRDWIGGKGEAEVLHYQILSALEKAATSGAPASGGGVNPGFVNQNFQLGGGHANPVGAGGAPPAGVHSEAPTSLGGVAGTHAGGVGEVAPDESVSSGTTSGKVAGY